MPFCKLIVLPDFAMIFICFENTSFFLNVVRNFDEHDFLAYNFFKGPQKINFSCLEKIDFRAPGRSYMQRPGNYMQHIAARRSGPTPSLPNFISY